MPTFSCKSYFAIIQSFSKEFRHYCEILDAKFSPRHRLYKSDAISTVGVYRVLQANVNSISSFTASILTVMSRRWQVKDKMMKWRICDFTKNTGIYFSITAWDATISHHLYLNACVRVNVYVRTSAYQVNIHRLKSISFLLYLKCKAKVPLGQLFLPKNCYFMKTDSCENAFLKITI